MYTENVIALLFQPCSRLCAYCSGQSLRLGCSSSWPSEIGGSEEESYSLLSLSLNRPKLGPKGKDGDGDGEAVSSAVSAVGRSVSNEVGRNDHDDGGEVHDALIRDRQIQMDEKKEKPKLIASARESVGGEGYFGAFLHSKYNLPRDYLLLPFPLGITAPELCCSSQDLQPSGCFGGVSSSSLDSFVKTR